jgi:senataxin
VGASKALLIGDPQQLPSTVFSREAYDLGYGISTMERLMKSSSVETVMLTEQYRMASELREWPSSTFYGGKLIDHASIVARPG